MKVELGVPNGPGLYVLYLILNDEVVIGMGMPCECGGAQTMETHFEAEDVVAHLGPLQSPQEILQTLRN